MRRVVAVIGAGIAGLCAALTAHENGDDVVVFDGDDEPGGTTRMSAGWIWTYRDLATFRTYAPTGSPELQQAQLDHFDDAVVWLGERGVEVLSNDTRNPLTHGIRIAPDQLVDQLASLLSHDSLRLRTRVVELRRPADDAHQLTLIAVEEAPGVVPRQHELQVDEVILAGGGYGGDLQRVATVAGAGADPSHWVRRNAGTALGSGWDLATGLGALTVPGESACYTRLVPLGVAAALQRQSKLGAAWGSSAVLIDAHGREIDAGPTDWSDSGRAWKLAASGAPHGWVLLSTAVLSDESRSTGTIGHGVQIIREAGGRVMQATPAALRELLADEGIDASLLPRSSEACGIAIAVQPGIVHTVGGLRTTTDGSLPTLERKRHRCVNGIRAVGVETGGIGGGGYASGLAQGLVQARLCNQVKQRAAPSR